MRRAKKVPSRLIADLKFEISKYGVSIADAVAIFRDVAFGVAGGGVGAGIEFSRAGGCAALCRVAGDGEPAESVSGDASEGGGGQHDDSGISGKRIAGDGGARERQRSECRDETQVGVGTQPICRKVCDGPLCGGDGDQGGAAADASGGDFVRGRARRRRRWRRRWRDCWSRQGRRPCRWR